jgi:glycosyltransferase involved in cell wall biosynthesis
MKYFNLDKNKAFISRNGVNLSLFQDNSIKRDRYRLIYSSEPARGLDVLLDIFPKVKKDFPQLSLYIFSDYEFYGQAKGSAYEEYKHVFEKTKQPGIHNLGNIKQTDLAKEFLRSYIFAYPTHFEETSCISAIEAQAAGVPVLTTRLAALPETVQDNVTGKLISGNSRSWLYKYRFIKELKSLLSDEKKWEILSKNGLERARNCYSWEMIAKEWIKEFNPYL